MKWEPILATAIAFTIAMIVYGQLKKRIPAFSDFESDYEMEE